jgi:hypothetical protein
VNPTATCPDDSANAWAMVGEVIEGQRPSFAARDAPRLGNSDPDPTAEPKRELGARALTILPPRAAAARMSDISRMNVP